MEKLQILLNEELQTFQKTIKVSLGNSVELELLGLHTGNITRYRLRPSEFEIEKKDERALALAAICISVHSDDLGNSYI